ncbi:antitoxin Xre-like helix-turn-helix domain-containing protein [Streptomyces sp. IMTB 1903]|uniref:antitoxin Xre-like helix-turn-helix domain-containing protein n=1 Tax=Streptomyces sp. IMTB 1903 TaxID=1776680 RepID=UPI0007540734|nr:antitoxin Xre-like helix-turn-helix domain-containing protein [Streptomyces sp. IMTB 1903]
MADELDNGVGGESEVAAGLVQGRAWEVVRLIGQGLGRNEIAKLTGVSTATVSRIAKRNGLTFDRTQTEKALKARISDLNLRQAGLAEALADRVAVAIAFADAATDYREWAYAWKAINDATQAYRRMKPELTQDDAIEDAKSFLGDLMDGIKLVNAELKAREMQEETPND